LNTVKLDNKKTHLILIRHGETKWNAEGRWQGQADIPLNPRGMRQAKEMAKSLADRHLDAIYSSDLLRARQTAEQLARVSGQTVHYDRRLREIDQGLWEGMLLNEIQSGYASLLERRRSDPWKAAPPGGETISQVHDRVIECVEEILKNHSDQTVAIVSHGFALALILASYLHQPVEKTWELIPKNCEALEINVISQKE
jgi:probable phosphoglycerate mutase